MLSGSWPIHSSRVWRAIYVVSILLVFSYIFFDVLDLDGSNFPRLFTPVERTIIVAVVPSGTQLNYSSDESELRGDISLLFVDRSSRIQSTALGRSLKSLTTRYSSVPRLPSGPGAKLSSRLLSLFVTAVFSLIL